MGPRTRSSTSSPGSIELQYHHHHVSTVHQSVSSLTHRSVHEPLTWSLLLLLLHLHWGCFCDITRGESSASNTQYTNYTSKYENGVFRNARNYNTRHSYCRRTDQPSKAQAVSLDSHTQQNTFKTRSPQCTHLAGSYLRVA